MFLLTSPAVSPFPPDGAVAGLEGLVVSTLFNFLLGFLFSFANIDCLATKEILCCLGELEPPTTAVAVVDDVAAAAPEVLPVEDLEADAGFALAVAVISRPAAVFLEDAELGLVEDCVMVVLALVILGATALTDATAVLGTDLTLLANVEVIFAWHLALSSDFSRLQVTAPAEAC